MLQSVITSVDPNGYLSTYHLSVVRGKATVTLETLDNVKSRSGSEVIERSRGVHFPEVRSDLRCCFQATLVSKVLRNYQKIKFSISSMSAAGLVGPNLVLIRLSPLERFEFLENDIAKEDE